MIEWQGKQYSIRQLAKWFELDRKTLSTRLRAGMPIEEALAITKRHRASKTRRAEAIEAGSNKYDGKLCQRHQTTLRYVYSSECVYCRKEANMRRV